MQVVEAWGLLLHSTEALGAIQPFLYDLVDVGRQVRCLSFNPYVLKLDLPNYTALPGVYSPLVVHQEGVNGVHTFNC